MDNRTGRYAEELVIHHDPLSSISEAFKIVRTNIEFSSIDKKLQAIAITSTDQGEGKSSVVANLALSFAQIGRSVLLVDADMRRPMLHKLFSLSNRRGLTNALISIESYKDYIQPSMTQNLSILTAGPIPPNPAELLMSNHMNLFMEDVKADYDLVIFDCPPVGVVTDAAILSTKVDGTIYVVRNMQVDKRRLKRAAELLAQVNAKVLGYVFTGIKPNTNDYYYYQYNHGNSNSGASKKHKKKRIKEPYRRNEDFISPPSFRISQPLQEPFPARQLKEQVHRKAGLETEND